MLKSSLLAFILGFIFVGNHRIDGASLIKVDDILWDNENCKGMTIEFILFTSLKKTGKSNSNFQKSGTFGNLKVLSF